MEDTAAALDVTLDVVKTRIHECLDALAIYDDCAFVDAPAAAE